jgi:CheY-like chemotaxis protein
VTASDRTGTHILVVEDDEAVRSLTSRMLAEEGYAVSQAQHGAEALALLENGLRVALVVTDVVMPIMDGRELGRRLAASRPELPVLYISAYNPSDIFSRGVPHEGAPFLRKPFLAADLIAVVHDLLATGGQPDRTRPRTAPA